MIPALRNLFPAPAVLGIELTPEAIHLALVQRQGGRAQLKQALREPLGVDCFRDGEMVRPDLAGDRLRQILKQHRLPARRTVMALPTQDAITRLVPLPAELEDADLEALLSHQEAALYLPYAREEADLDYLKLDYFIDIDEIEKVNVLMVATRKAITDRYLEVSRSAGLSLAVLEPAVFALIRALREPLRQFSSQEAVVLISLNPDNTEISILVDSIPRFSRVVPSGGWQLLTLTDRAQGLIAPPELERLLAIPVRLGDEAASGSPEEQALLRGLRDLEDELRRSVDFYLSQDSQVEVVQLYLSGAVAALEGLADYFTERLGLPTALVDPFSEAGLEGQLSAEQRPALATAIGLALREG